MLAECTSCPEDYYIRVNGSSSCDKCAFASTSDATRTGCVCVSGFFMEATSSVVYIPSTVSANATTLANGTQSIVVTPVTSYIGNCLLCPDGADCAFPGTPIWRENTQRWIDRCVK